VPNAIISPILEKQRDSRPPRRFLDVWRCMSLLKLFSPNDPELVEKTLARLSEQDTWNDVFSTKLIELLDKIDLIKSESRERLRRADDRIERAESLAQTESLLREKMTKYGEASERLQLAEVAAERATSLAIEAKDALWKANELLDSARLMTIEARSLAEDTNRKLKSAQETQLRAEQSSHRAFRFAVVAVALSWSAMAWSGCFIFRSRPSVLVALLLSCLIFSSAAFLIMKEPNEARTPRTMGNGDSKTKRSPEETN